MRVACTFNATLQASPMTFGQLATDQWVNAQNELPFAAFPWQRSYTNLCSVGLGINEPCVGVCLDVSVRMVGKKTNLTMDFGDKDTERSPEEQLEALQRAYRPAELKRAIFYSKTQSALNKQQHIVDILDKEKTELELKYKKAKERIFLREDALWLRQFEDLLKCQSTSKAIKDEESQKIKETDEKMRQIDKQMHQLRLQLIQMRKSKCPISSNEKVIQILENRLYQESVVHNKVVYKNSLLREYLQHLLILRTRFNILYSQYSKILNKGKSKIDKLCKEATAAQDQRDEIRAHLLSLNKFSTIQYNKLVQEVQEMTRLAKLKGQHVPFMMKKEKSRAEYTESFGLKQEKVDTKPEEQLKFYQATFDKIKSATKKTDAIEIAKHFIQAEEANFKLFNYANELRDESEHIQEKIDSFKEKLREANMQDEIEQEKFGVAREKLEQKLKEKEAKSHLFQEKLNSCQETFNELKEGILNLYSKSGCSDENLRKMLMGEKGLTKESALDYLSVFESWISDLIPFSDYLTSRVKAAEEGKEIIGKRVATPKYDVDTYSKLSTLSDNINPSIRASISSIEPLDVGDIKMASFPDFDLPELSKELSSTVHDELQISKEPYSRSELKTVAAESLWKNESQEKT